ncbi:MAG TPA: VOC family protein [Dehalococcoidia bacterium]
MPDNLRSLRQVALITRGLDESQRFWTRAFGLEECFRDDLSRYGLRNVLLPIGHAFLELLAADDSNSAGARFLERHGEGLYMAIFQVADVAALERHLADQQVPVVERIDRPQHKAVQLHPKAMGRVMTSFEHGTSVEEWPAAGPNWRPHVHTELLSGIAGVGFITDDADRDVGRWHRLFGVVPSRYWGAGRDAYRPGSPRLGRNVCGVPATGRAGCGWGTLPGAARARNVLLGAGDTRPRPNHQASR